MPSKFFPASLSAHTEQSWYSNTSKWQYAEAAMRLALQLVRGRTSQERQDLALGLVVNTIEDAKRLEPPTRKPNGDKRQ